jgi:hypothetical protein
MKFKFLGKKHWEKSPWDWFRGDCFHYDCKNSQMGSHQTKKLLHSKWNKGVKL